MYIPLWERNGYPMVLELCINRIPDRAFYPWIRKAVTDKEIDGKQQSGIPKIFK